jgi:hypothetical protein
MYGNYCYKVFPSGSSNFINWFDAQKKCEDVTSNLASIHDLNEQSNVASLIPSDQSVKYIWIGLNRTVPHNNTWIWTDGTATDFYYWQPRNPDDYASNVDGEACVSISSNERGWVDIPCLMDTQPVSGFVCKKRKPR